MINIIAWIIFGALAGWIASIIMKTNAEQGAVAPITGVSLIVGVEVPFRLAHERCGAQRIANLVDVQAFQPGVHGHGPDGRVLR